MPRKAIIVEDTVDIARMLQFFIETDLCWDVELVTQDFDQLLNHKRWSGVDAVICDLMLPEIEGITILQWLKVNMPYVRRVVLSAVSFFKPEVWEVADVVLQKPTSMTDLKIALESL